MTSSYHLRRDNERQTCFVTQHAAVAGCIVGDANVEQLVQRQLAEARRANARRRIELGQKRRRQRALPLVDQVDLVQHDDVGRAQLRQRDAIERRL